VSYRPVLTGHALTQFKDLLGDEVAYEALMSRILALIHAPWDAFGEDGLLSFRVDEHSGLLVIFNILWTG